MYNRGAGGGAGGAGGGGGSAPGQGARGGHRPNSSIGGSLSGRTAELTSAYAALAAELTKKEIKSVGGYTIGRVIGQGSFGKVHIGVHRLTNTRVAIKQVPKSLPFTSDPSSPLSLLTREIHHHRRLRHPHILALYEVIATESSIYLITELCTGGELFDYLVEKGRLSAHETRRIFGQLCLGVAHLHGKGVVHRDLKLENVLLDERVNVKICDLGFGREFEKGRWMDTWVGSLGYSAPEMVGAKRYLGEEVDIWSLGVILFTLLTGSLPFDDDDEGVMKTKILACDYEVPSWIDDDAADLIRSILQLDPLRRLSVKGILAHKFFTRPPPQPIFERSPSELNHQTHDAFPPSIPEEPTTTSSDDAPPTFSSHHHTLFPSGVSDSSFFTASSDSELAGENENSRSGATTPITSEDGSAAATSASSVGNLLEDEETKLQPEAVDQDVRSDGGGERDGDKLGLKHRNESQTTIRKGESDPSLATPSSSRGRSPLTTVEEPSSPQPPSSPSFQSSSNLPISPITLSPPHLIAPSLQRNASNTSTLSAGGSPIPIHARTPSRTKRHSVGSIFSERLFPLDEEPPLPTRIDYLSLLSKPIPAPLSTPSEKDLLQSLTGLGFDTGQIVHSVMTDACDASGAVWWMLKRKRDEAEREKEEEEEELLGLPVGGSMSSRKKGKDQRSPALLQNIFDEHVFEEPVQDDDEEILGKEESEKIVVGLGVTPTTPRIGTPELPSTSPSRSLHGLQPEEQDDNKLCYFIHQNGAGSASAPLLPYFPPVDSNTSSPTRRQPTRSKSKDHLRDQERSPTSSVQPLPSQKITPPLTSSAPFLSPPISSGSPPKGTFGELEASPSSSSMGGGKKNRTRSSSVSMLQRAASAVGSSLALKKAAEGGSNTPTPEDGRSTPTAAIAGLFHRKNSVPDDLSAIAAGTTSPSSSKELDLPTPTISPTTPSKKLAGVTISPQPSPSISNSDSHETFDTIEEISISGKGKKIPALSNTPAASKTGSKSSSSKGGNLFSNLKFWFGDDRRKGKKRTLTRGGSSTTLVGEGSPRVGGSGSMRRSMRADGSYVNSPLVKPPLGSRRSSNGSIIPPSRRSSMNSVHRGRPGRDPTLASPSLGHHRRRSDSSRASTSDLEHSRPPSLRSNSGRRQHTKTGSVSSHSTPVLPPPTPKEVYRRPPTTTTVRRHHGSANRHSRNRSTGSSITRHSSNSSIGGDESQVDEQTSGEAAIIEEDETGDDVDRSSPTLASTPSDPSQPAPPRRKSSSEDEARQASEREKAFRKLSGEFETVIAQSELRHSRPSRDSLDSHHSTSSHHTPVVFSAHKTHHVFGAPSQPSSHSVGRKSSHSTLRPALRDVFAAKDTDGDWVDESDDLGGYGGGLGQASTRFQRPDSEASTNSSLFSMSSGAHSTIPSTASIKSERESLEFPNSTGGSYLFEGRYAGLAATAQTQQSAEGNGATWRGNRPPAFRSAAVIEEDEEDEED